MPLPTLTPDKLVDKLIMAFVSAGESVQDSVLLTLMFLTQALLYSVQHGFDEGSRQSVLTEICEILQAAPLHPSVASRERAASVAVEEILARVLKK